MLPAPPLPSDRLKPDAVGLTLLELIVVMAIITILAGVAVPTMSSFIDRKTTDESAHRMELITSSVKEYARDLLEVPRSLDDLATRSGRAWRGPYIPRYIQGWFVKDPDYRNDNWGRPFQWRRQSKVEGTLRSAGADGRFGNRDDLELTVDIRPILREITLDRLTVVNTAIGVHNAQALGRRPLHGSIQRVVRTLQRESLLPRSQDWNRDAFGDLLVVDGTPVTGVHSKNLLNGFQNRPGGRRGSRPSGRGPSRHHREHSREH